MAKDDKKLYLELQMDELKGSLLEEDENPTPVKKKVVNNNRSPQNAEIAKLYEDAAEYEADLKGFEDELEVVKANALKDIPAALIKEFPEENKERDYAKELKTIVDQCWTHAVEVDKTHPKEQLELVKNCEFGEVVEKLSAAYPDVDFEAEVRAHLVKRWDNLITIKKAHVAEEIADIKTSGLKPKYAKRVYELYHGLR
ncbi:MAG: hypothetical protein GQ531_08200 [Sulfurovum sp.]|nr:hypothetical protein [Sulfurovum sp.]